ncbi:MAG: hypothetical protein AB2615_01610, partial [Candidatus Thiodiazotropha sp.]
KIAGHPEFGRQLLDKGIREVQSSGYAQPLGQANIMTAGKVEVAIDEQGLGQPYPLSLSKIEIPFI